MSWFTSIISGGVDKVVDSVGNGLDNLFTSDEEKLVLRNELQKEMNKLSLELESKANEYEKEITKRWESDNEHLVTRLVRPFIVVWSATLLTVVMIADGNIGGFTVKEAYVPLLETIVTTAIVAYMGMRTFDKHSKNKHKGN